jgi:hypothetical protein
MAVLQVSANGVWGDPLTLALRAADLVVLAPLVPLSELSKGCQSRDMVRINEWIITVLSLAGRAVVDAPVKWASPFMSRDELLGELPRAAGGQGRGLNWLTLH